MTSLIGQWIGPYEIREEIGRGAMGIVYRASQPSLARDVAVKTLPPYLVEQDDRAVDRFLREARAAAHLTHPNIVTVHDVGSKDGCYYLVMELVDGCPLNRVLEDGPLPLREASEIVSKVGEALDYAHSRGVIHRDVKPSNILIGDNGTVKLADFGIARIMQEPSLTVTGLGFGTPSYVAPELLNGGEATPSSDLYALGVVLFELLTGQPPYTGPLPAAILYQQVHEPVPSASALAAGLPPGVDAFFQKALAKKPQERLPTGAAFAALLRPLVEVAASETARGPAGPVVRTSQGARSANATVTPVAPVKQSSKWPVLLAGALAVLALIGIAVALLLSRGDGRNNPPVGTALAATKITPAAPGAEMSAAALLRSPEPSHTATAKPSPTRTPFTPTPTPTSSPTPAPTSTVTASSPPTSVPPELLRPADGARVTGTVTLECRGTSGAAAYQVQTRVEGSAASAWRSWPRSAKCSLTLVPAREKALSPGRYQWRVVALDASGLAIATSAVRTLVIPRPAATATPMPSATRPPATVTAAPAAPAPQPGGPNSPTAVEPPTRTPEPLPVSPTRTPEPLPTS